MKSLGKIKYIINGDWYKGSDLGEGILITMLIRTFFAILVVGLTLSIIWYIIFPQIKL